MTLAPVPINVKTALVHDWFQGYFGADQVVDEIRRGLFGVENQPDLFTFYAARDRIPPELAARIRRESRLSRLPGMRQRGMEPGAWKYLLPFMPLYFRRLQLHDYDLVLSSSHSFAMHVRARSGVLHVCYCHTPMRYAWMPAEAGDRERGVAGIGLRAARTWLQRLDRRGSMSPDSFVANSTAVRDRIQRFYGRDAAVIHPPVKVEEFTPTDAPGSYFLWVHRLVPHKRPELVAEAFRGLRQRLTMVGVGMLEPSLRRSLPPNVTLLPWLSRAELVRLFERATGFVHIGEEDFGISMVEALAAGTPVIALARGGALDIVRDGVDGLLIDAPNVPNLREAILESAGRRWEAEALALRARQFSRERFIMRFREHLAKLGVD